MSELLHTVVLIIHVLGASLIIGTIFVALLVQQYKLTAATAAIEKSYNILRFVFLVQILSGVYLAAAEWTELRTNPYLWTKFVLLAIAIIAAAVVVPRQQKKPASYAWWGWFAFIVFALIATLGVLIAETVM